MTKNAVRREKRAALMKALETAKPDRKLVAEGFREHLKLLGPTWPRGVRFYRNLRAAYLSDSYGIGAYTNNIKSSGPVEDRRFNVIENANSSAWMALGLRQRDKGLRPRDKQTAWEVALRSTDDSFPTPLDPFIQIVQGGCLVFWVGRLAVHVVLARIYTQKGGIHREDGPAIQYEDGSGVWFLKGVLMPKQYVLHPEKITPRKILTEDNAETRRVMIEGYGGWERFMQDAHPEVLDTEGQNQLIRIPVEVDGESPYIALKLRCSSTGRLYVLRVAPWVQKVKQALAWTFELVNARAYQLEAET